MKILIEGCDFSGKTTLAKNLKYYIEKNYDSCEYYHNPKGHLEISRNLYEEIKQETDEVIKNTKLLLSHANNVKEINKIATNNHTVVDRSIFSYYAYQLRHKSIEDTYQLFYDYLGFSQQDFYFDVAVGLTANLEDLKKRAKKQNDELDDYFIQNMFEIKACFDNFKDDILIDSPVKLSYNTSMFGEQDLLNEITRVLDGRIE